MKVIVVNGAPECGKTTFEYYCHRIKQEVVILSMIDFVKKIASSCGWDETKTPKNRKFLSDLKDLLENWNDIPYKKLVEQLNIYKFLERTSFGGLEYFCFVDAREAKDIERLKKDFEVITIYIKRNVAEEKITEQLNHADLEIKNYNYDIIIDNNNTLDSLELSAKSFIEHLRKI